MSNTAVIPTAATATDYSDDSDNPIGDTTLGGFGYGMGLSGAVLAIFVVITYFSYKCKKSSHPNSLSSSSFRSRYFAGDYGDGAPVQVVVRREGLDAAAIAAIPLYTYDQLRAHGGAAAGGGCAVCLGEYKESEEVRLMPECGHVFHRSCIDPWLVIHPTCPICRNTAAAVAVVEQPATVANQ